MALTVTAINAAKPRSKPYKLTDGRGLYLLVTPIGSRLWRMNYRHDGKQKTLAFGAFPDVTLAKAREKRAAAREEMADDLDPIEVRKDRLRKARDGAKITFRLIGEEWLERSERQERAPKTLKKLR